MMKPHYIVPASMIFGIAGAFLFLHLGIITVSIACLLLALVATVVLTVLS